MRGVNGCMSDLGSGGSWFDPNRIDLLVLIKEVYLILFLIKKPVV